MSELLHNLLNARDVPSRSATYILIPNQRTSHAEENVVLSSSLPILLLAFVLRVWPCGSLTPASPSNGRERAGMNESSVEIDSCRQDAQFYRCCCSHQDGGAAGARSPPAVWCPDTKLLRVFGPALLPATIRAPSASYWRCGWNLLSSSRLNIGRDDILLCHR